MGSIITASDPPQPTIGDRSYGIIAIRCNPPTSEIPEHSTLTIANTLVLLIKQRTLRPETHPSFWTFPKGHAEPSDESKKHTAMRELLEETGLVISPDDILSFPVTCSRRGIGEANTGEKIDAEKDIIEFREVYVNPIRKVGKEVRYWPAVVIGEQQVELQQEEVEEYRWCEWAEAEGLITFSEGRAVLRQVKDCLGGGR